MNHAERFWAKVNKNGPLIELHPERGPCWLWTKCLDRHGYGRFWLGGKNRHAIRVAWELAVGPLESKWHLDHMCLRKTCVNPAHLEKVSLVENVVRAHVERANAGNKSFDKYEVFA